MKRILLATDGSEYAKQAAKFLSHLPHDDELEITVVSALYVPASNRRYLTGDWVQVCLDQDQQRSDEEFESIKALFEGANVSLKHVVRKGHPGEEIVAAAREVKAELVVLGAKGKSTVERLLLGSTSDYVATHAPCSVLVVRPTDALTANRPIRIAIGYEETGPAQAAVEEFCDFSWGSEPDVRLVNVSYGVGFFEDGSRELAGKAVRAAAEEVRRAAPNAIGEHLEGDHFGETLVNYAEEHEIDVFVVGETQRSRLGRVLMGSMTRFVLRHAPCSVWITRNRMIHGATKPLSTQAAGNA